MKLATLRRGRKDVTLPGVSGPARLDRRTPDLIKRLSPGDVAVIDHVDLDRGTAEALVHAGVAAVVNAAPSISGRFPNLGPEILVGAGVPLLDGVGAGVFGEVKDGAAVRLDGDSLYAGEKVIAQGAPQDADTVAEAMREAREGLTTQLEAFAANTMEYLRTERGLLLDGVGVPDVATKIDGRHVLVVVRGYDDEKDLRALQPYLKEYRPVLVGVDGGADVLLAAGHTPDLIVGDVHQVSDAALRCGAEVVVRAEPDGRIDGVKRLQDLGVATLPFPGSGTSEDLAMMLADTRGASLIVAVGTHATLTEFLDRGRTAMASTFLTRLRVGGKLVDGKAVTRLYRTRVSGGALLLLVLAALVAVVAALVVSAAGDSLATALGDLWRTLSDTVSGWL